MKIDIDIVIETSLLALYSRDIFSESLYLKGGQALRIKEQLRNRFSADLDFSCPTKVTDEDVFFEMLLDALAREFLKYELCLFDFKFTRRPRIKVEGTPDFWSGWAIEFKLIEESKRNNSIEKKRREALIPGGSKSSKVTIDISEHEYCGAVESVQLKGTAVKVYSRTLLLCEKIRAICQQHPDYLYKAVDERGRDYYDIERLWNKVLADGVPDKFIDDCVLHIKNVFAAKDVALDLLTKIFLTEFVDYQRAGWASVELTVSGKLQPFDYYNESLKILILRITDRLQS